MLSQVAKCSVMKFYPFLRSVVDIRGSHKSRYTNYLSLDLKDDERHSLTVFCAADAICCIQIDGNPQRRLGEPSEKCCPITFFLEAGEKIHSLVVVTRRSREIRHAQGPFLLVSAVIILTVNHVANSFKGAHNVRSQSLLRTLHHAAHSHIPSPPLKLRLRAHTHCPRGFHFPFVFSIRTGFKVTRGSSGTK